MKKFLLLMIAVAVVALYSSATKIYVCGTKITGTTSFNVTDENGNVGTVSYNDYNRTLTISNVNYIKTGSSNNGISVDEVSGDLTIILEGTVTFDIKDADAVLCKSGKTTYINVIGTSTFICRSNSHAGLKLQNGNVILQGTGYLDVENLYGGHAIKGGAGTEQLTFNIKKCYVYSADNRLYNLGKVTINPTGTYGSDDFSTKITLQQQGSGSYAPAANISSWSPGTNVKIFSPLEYYGYSITNLTSTVFTPQVIISDITPVAVINSTYFPDANFRSYLMGLYSKGYITTSDVNARTSMSPSSQNILTLQGIGYFNKLTTLNCSSNGISQLDLSALTSLTTLNASSNQLTSINLPSSLETLNLSNNKKFTTFNMCNKSALKSVDLSECTGVTSLSMYNNTAMTTLNVSNCSALTSLSCYNDKLSSLNLSGCSSLTTLDCHSNQLTSISNIPTSVQTLNCSSNKFSGTFSLTGRSALTSFDISNNPSLTTVNVYSNSALTSLNVQNCSAMTTLQCYSNKLSSLYLTGCSALVYLSCQSNQITSLSNLPTSLQTIYCNDNKLSGTFDVINRSALKTLDIKNNPNLTTLNCYSNGLTSLNVQNCSAMTTLQCYSNQLTSLNFTGCSALTTLDCHSNQLTTLSNIPSSVQTLNCSSNKFSGTFQLVGRSALKSFDISSNPNITTLDCYSNALTSLSVTNCSAMTKIYCYNNQLTSLNFSGCSALYYLDCENNKLTSLSISNNTALKEVYAGHNQISTAPAFSSGNQSTLEILVLNDNKLTSFTAQNFTKLWGLYLADNPNLTLVKVTNNSALKTLQVFNCPALTTLTCYSNALTSGNTSSGFCFTGSNAITNFNCYNNQLTSLDVSSLSNLTELKCYNNKITSLNVSNKTKLTELRCNYNQIPSLNVQGCSALTYMDCGANQLYSLSVQGCNSLTELNCCLNQITESGANTLVNSLRTIPAGSQGTLNFVAPGYSNSGVAEANVITAAQVITARNKRWIPMKFVNSQWVEIPVSIVGDVDGDGFVTSADVTALYNYMLNNDSSAIVNGDQDGDGNITSADVTVVYNILLGQ